jgi:hypothetical protein
MLLHNRYFLYFIFLIAFLDFLYLGYIEDIESVSIFILVGILTAFFNKNMIVVLSSSLIITNVLKYTGIEKALTEGLENESDGEEDDEDDKTTKPSETPKPKKKKASIKEEFGQDEQVVYTSTEETVGEEKMVLAHEKLLEKMNKYKPLLDTLSGLTKNIAIMKQIGQDAKSISDDNTEEYEKETADVKPKAIKKKADKEE